MATPEAFATRQTLVDSWRLRLEESSSLPESDGVVQKITPRTTGRDAVRPHGALALARQAESEALAEYSRIPRAFTELTVNGKVPEERSAAGSDSL
jgi:hypothetical protein